MKLHATFESITDIRKFCSMFGASEQRTGSIAAVPPTPAEPNNWSPKEAPATQIPTTQPTYSLDELSVAAAALMDAGKQPDLLGLLQKYSVKGLFELPQEMYGAFATDLRGLGAKI